MRRWALSGQPTELKARALRRVVVPAVVAAGAEFEREVPFGFRFGGNARDLLEMFVSLFGVWEPNLTAFLVDRLGPDDLFVDVGANSGWFTLLGGTRVGPGGGVVAVEASPLIAERLRRNLGRNDLTNVRVLVAAAGREPGTVTVELGPAEHTGLTRVHAAGVGVADGAVRIPCDTLPALLEPDEISRARVVKIDVEGAEYDVVAGLAPHLDRFPPTCEFVVEVGPRRTGDPGDVARLLAAFTEQGFAPYRLPNAYDIRSYLFAQVPRVLERIDGVPQTETDVVFSRAGDERGLPVG